MSDDRPFGLVGRTERFAGKIFDVVSDEVRMPGGGTAVRDYVRHPGAVGVVAVRTAPPAGAAGGASDVGAAEGTGAADGEVQVLLVRQYRHPVARELWELPAGLLDVDGERAAATAARELAEEADLVAGRWDVLVDLLTTPGASDESIRLYLARDLRPVPAADRHTRTHEEASMTTRWVALDDAVEDVFAGVVENAAAAAGVLAAAVARTRNWEGLRPVDAPWPARPER